MNDLFFRMHTLPECKAKPKEVVSFSSALSGKRSEQGPQRHIHRGELDITMQGLALDLYARYRLFPLGSSGTTTCPCQGTTELNHASALSIHPITVIGAKNAGGAKSGAKFRVSQKPSGIKKSSHR
ncbi:hypothetical protein [Pseudomonas pseudonitroreducens]|uniref:hypothetical protein n=1 Tax=Pseudomonas pseudonitroreducens TaxID=2892326 RepID=UPI001F3E4C4F|nr:hypothetical protein [Pseudomonas pseudonitroreducens]